MSMGEYEIRIIKANGSSSLVYSCAQFNEEVAIRRAERIPRDAGDRLEVWRGMDCIYRDPGLLVRRFPTAELPQVLGAA
jgi:hypothetical protein